jgi:hypothetical protein
MIIRDLQRNQQYIAAADRGAVKKQVPVSVFRGKGCGGFFNIDLSCLVSFCIYGFFVENGDLVLHFEKLGLGFSDVAYLSRY